MSATHHYIVGFLSLVRRERLNSASYTMEMSKLNSLLKSRLFPTGHAYTEIPRWTISIWLSVMSPGVIRTTSLPIILRLRISGVKDSPASRSALKTAEPVHSKGATCTASTSAGTRTAACARGIVYSAYPPFQFIPFAIGLSHIWGQFWEHISHGFWTFPPSNSCLTSKYDISNFQLRGLIRTLVYVDKVELFWLFRPLL